MAQSATTPADLIMEAIAHHPSCGLDELVMLCPDCTWNQIFLEVDRLSRCGHLRLVLIGPGRYAVAVPTDERSYEPQARDAPLRLPVLTRCRQDGQCERCGGLMVSEDCDNFKGWRCILCGERIDPVILAQRQKAGSAGLQLLPARV